MKTEPTALASGNASAVDQTANREGEAPAEAHRGESPAPQERRPPKDAPSVPLPRVSKPKAILPLIPVDTAPLTALLQKLSETVWEREDASKPNKFPCFHHTRHIVLRSIPDQLDPRDVTDSPAWPMFAPILLPIMQQVVQPYGFRQPAFPKVMFARLEAGQQIDEHVDGAPANFLTHKIHVPIRTSDEVLFYLKGRAHHLDAGYAYEVNNVVRHHVVNGGAEDRVHFIFEVYEGAAAGV